MKIVGLLLAGGRSRRLGRDKRFLEFQSKPLILRAYEAAAALTDEIWVLLANPQDEPKIQEALGPRPMRFAFDPEPGAGPLGALAAALPRIESEYALLLAVDQPHLTGEFLKRLIEYGKAQAQDVEVVVPLWRGVLQVTCALYRPLLASELNEAFRRGERSLRRWVESLPKERVRTVPEETWRTWAHGDVFFDVNTPEDYEHLKRIPPA